MTYHSCSHASLLAVDSSNPPLVANNELVLTLTENGGGTRVSTTRNVLYGTIQANMRTVATAGVVTAFITMVRAGLCPKLGTEHDDAATLHHSPSPYHWNGGS